MSTAPHAPAGETVELTVLKHLAAGRGLTFVAEVTGLGLAQVARIGGSHGHPDRDQLASAVAKLTRDNDDVQLAALERPAATAEPPVPPPVPRPSPPPVDHRAGRHALSEVPVDELHPDPDNPRTDPGDLTDLAASMASAGLLQPVVARRDTDGRLIIVMGHRRRAAAKLLGWSTVEVVVRRAMAPDSVLAAMLIENGQRTDLDPIEEARGLARLLALTGCTVTELSRRVGRHQTVVSGRLALLALPIEEQEALRQKQMTLGEATDRARSAAGTKRPKGYTGAWYLGAEHPLAARARGRCTLQHEKARLLGAVACGECWETVIRADERRTIHQHSASGGQCAICGMPYGPGDAASDTPPAGEQP